MIVYNKYLFNDRSDSFIQLRENYKDSFDLLYNNALNSVCKKEYAKGCFALHLGYYSPSYEELYVGGVKRGRLLKSGNTNYDYEYWYDEYGKMICSIFHTGGAKDQWFDKYYEFFIYENGKCNVSVEYNKSVISGASIFSISEYTINGTKLTELARAVFSINKKPDEIKIEQSEYENELLSTAIISDYIPAVNIINNRKLTFYRENDGRISTYRIQALDTDGDPVDNGYVYDIPDKRDI